MLELSPSSSPLSSGLKVAVYHSIILRPPKPTPFPPIEPQLGRATGRSKGNPNREIATRAKPRNSFSSSQDAAPLGHTNLEQDTPAPAGQDDAGAACVINPNVVAT